MLIRRLGGWNKKFISEQSEIVMDAFSYFEPMKRA